MDRKSSLVNDLLDAYPKGVVLGAGERGLAGAMVRAGDVEWLEAVGLRVYKLTKQGREKYAGSEATP